MHAGWSDTEWEEWEAYQENQSGVTPAGNTEDRLITKYKVKKVWGNANADPYDNVYYFTQS